MVESSIVERWYMVELSNRRIIESSNGAGRIFELSNGSMVESSNRVVKYGGMVELSDSPLVVLSNHRIVG